MFRSGFVTLVGRPNVGKSTLLNAICGQKVSIVSDKPQTTRTQVRGVYTRDDAQIVFVDTPGIHKPVTALGERLNATAEAALADVDVVCLVIDGTAPVGRGDQWVARHCPPERTVLVVNKDDVAGREAMLAQLQRASELELTGGVKAVDVCELFPVSAKTRRGLDALVEHLVSRLPEGPAWYPENMVTDQHELVHIAELVREQLFRIVEDELPYSIATRVTEYEPPFVRCEILVERESQKGIVIGRGGEVLKRVGQAVRRQLPEGTYLELLVKVDKDWQRRPDRIERLLSEPTD